MDRTDAYLNIVMSNPLLLAPIVGLLLIFLLVPREKRLFLTLMMVTPWLQMGRSQELSTIAAVAKLSSGLAFLLIAFAAWTHPYPKRELPRILWIYPIMAFIWCILIVSVQERGVGIVLRLQWFSVTIAAIMLVRTVVTFSDFMRIINGVTVGCLIALLVPISALVLFPDKSFLRGIGRFQPYGANSNQIGMLFALAAPLLGYAMLTWPKKFKPFLIVMLSLTLGMALLTASRQTMLAILMTSFPILWVLSKRPIVTMFGLVVGIGGIGWIMSIGGEIAPLERLGSLETGRLQLWWRYITEVFTAHPLFGLFGTSGESYFRSNIIGQHPHSAWMNMMYHGGLVLFIPMFSMVIYSCYSGLQVWKNRANLAGSPLLYSLVFLLLLAMYVQGSFNQVVYWPTYSWSFLHVVLACFFIIVWHEIREGNIEGAFLEEYDPYDEDIETEEFSELENFEDYAAESQ